MNRKNLKYFAYILECSDGSFYVGSTQNVEERVKAHNSGRGAIFTFKRRPVRLVYQEGYARLEDAVKRERQLKKWSKAKKLSLIKGDMMALSALSK